MARIPAYGLPLDYDRDHNRMPTFMQSFGTGKSATAPAYRPSPVTAPVYTAASAAPARRLPSWRAAGPQVAERVVQLGAAPAFVSRMFGGGPAPSQVQFPPADPRLYPDAAREGRRPNYVELLAADYLLKERARMEAAGNRSTAETAAEIAEYTQYLAPPPPTIPTGGYMETEHRPGSMAGDERARLEDRVHRLKLQTYELLGQARRRRQAMAPR